jgi:hypothetical protein
MSKSAIRQRLKKPLKSTRKAIQDSRMHRNLTHAKDVDEMFRQLGIKLK